MGFINGGWVVHWSRLKRDQRFNRFHWYNWSWGYSLVHYVLSIEVEIEVKWCSRT